MHLKNKKTHSHIINNYFRTNCLIWHEPVETIDELIGKNYDYAHKMYFQTDPNRQYKVNANDNLNKFDGGILNKKEIMIDSIVRVFTWEYTNTKRQFG